MAWPEAIQTLDEAILKAAVGSPQWAVPVFLGLTLLGGGWGLLLLLPFMARRESRRAAAWHLASVLVTSIAVTGLKALFQRARPCDALGWCTPVSITSPGGHSFPSGHAAGAFAFATFLSFYAPRATGPALLCAALIGWSRCILGVHYPSDVLVGAAFGASVGAAFAIVSRSSWARGGAREG